MLIAITPELANLERFDINQLKPIQGNLKSLQTENYYKLRNSLINTGFISPLFVWKNPKDNFLYYADGHQRDKVIKGENIKSIFLNDKEMKIFEEQETPEAKHEFLNLIPKERQSFLFPCLEVRAKDETELKKRLLVISSQYGKMERKGFKDFIVNIEAEWLHDNFAHETIKTEIFTREEPALTTPEQPEEKEILTKEGDLYEIHGNETKHRILCGDATTPSHLTDLCNQPAHMVFIDPPYNVKIKDLGSNRSKLSAKHKKRTDNSISNHGEFKQGSGEMNSEQFTEFLRTVFQNLIDNCNRGAINYICMDWRHLENVLQAGKVYAELKNLCVWNKDNAGMGSFYRSKHEFIFTYSRDKLPQTPAKDMITGLKSWFNDIYKKYIISELPEKPIFYFDVYELVFCFKAGFKKDKSINNFQLGQFGRSRSNVWSYPIVNSFANSQTGDWETKLHPTVKPLKLVYDCIIDCSNQHNNILDTFLGSGTTLIAAEQAKRNCLGLEIDTKYIDTSIKRYINFMNHNKQKFTIFKNGKKLNNEEIEEFKK